MAKVTGTSCSTFLVDPQERILLQYRDEKARLFPNCWSVFTERFQESDREGAGLGPIAPYRACATRGIGEELKVQTAGGLESFVPQERLFHFFKGSYEDDTQAVDQYAFTGELYVPLERLVAAEGKRVDVFSLDQVRTMHIAANYGQFIEILYEKLGRGELADR